MKLNFDKYIWINSLNYIQINCFEKLALNVI